MVYRVYVEKKEALANEARALLGDLREFLGIRSLTGIRLLNRYDLENISRGLFDYAVKTMLSEPQLDTVSYDPPEGSTVFAVEYLPGQYDQRADSAAQCIQILSQGGTPHCAYSAGVCFGRHADGRTDCGHKEICNQPC